MFHLGHGYPITVRESAIGHAASLETPQADVGFVFALRGAGQVEVFDDMRRAVQDQHHAALEFSR
jgi:hypothetical protein